ncbi:AAA family ATPase [Xanthomonas sp. CFBP 8703]|uniref:AAA family ATPase n=1 Tax=Xanthomonas bonasiae TaxID=2810351 RepID=A0ABS3B2G6_9XANT|nr:AAA family ATPase [Xanthomonas bonasiae]MBN6102697.1 AAA family ATPase [Xanthomonas bonasiae]
MNALGARSELVPPFHNLGILQTLQLQPGSLIMQLITAIEIAYFRSIYKESLNELKDITILFGRNDSGKSNFLRALNLFFESQTNPGTSFDFLTDFNLARRSETDLSKGARKFAYIKIWFAAPSSWKNSLGESFWVKKQWSTLNQEEPNIESSVAQNKRHYLTRFLNTVRFHYIPAIKDRRIFEYLLGNVYSILSNKASFRESLGPFSNAIRDETENLSNFLKSTLNLDSVITPPTDLTNLFRSLDFGTTDEYGDKFSLTTQRGDGIQVRHIPAVLNFLSEHGKEDYHIWGFEEPENSLELASAIEEADEFKKYGKSSKKQIFVTSHSPAFFRQQGPEIKRFFIFKKVPDTLSKPCSSVLEINGLKPGSLPGELMGETPHLAIMGSHLEEISKQIERLKSDGADLTRQIEAAAAPILFVEGESDAKLMECAWSLFAGEIPAPSIQSCQGTTKMESLAGDGLVLSSLVPGKQIYVLVDNDRDGRELRKDKRLTARGGIWKQHNSNKTFWCRLAASDEFVSMMSSKGIPEQNWPATLENIFPSSTRVRAGDNYQRSTTPFKELLEPSIYPKISGSLQESDEESFYFLAPTPETKDLFVDWLIEQSRHNSDLLEPVRSVIEDLRNLIVQSEQGAG